MLSEDTLPGVTPDRVTGLALQQLDVSILSSRECVCLLSPITSQLPAPLDLYLGLCQLGAALDDLQVFSSSLSSVPLHHLPGRAY